MWEVEYTDEFGEWWETLTEGEHISVAACVSLLEQLGTSLGFPHSSDIRNAKHRHMRELRIQHCGKPYRVLYAFDPRRKAILLIGGNKKGDDKWYEKLVPLADKLYAEHLRNLKNEER